MNSTEINKIGISEWHPFNEKVLEIAPKKPGTYIIRIAGAEPFGRFRGTSDILYIGRTEGRRGLRHRFKQHLHPGPTQWTSQRVNIFIKKYKAEIAWFETDEPSNLEKKFIGGYLNEHEELPPLNRAEPRMWKKIFAEKLSFKDSVSQEKSV